MVTWSSACWRPLDDSVEQGKLYHLKAKKAAVFIHQLSLIIGQEYTQILAPQESCKPLWRLCILQKPKEVIRQSQGAYNRKPSAYTEQWVLRQSG